jgi:hypothetical protein
MLYYVLSLAGNAVVARAALQIAKGYIKGQLKSARAAFPPALVALRRGQHPRDKR